MPDKPLNLDAPLNRQTQVLRAQQIVAGALFAPQERITIRNIEKTDDGYFRVTFRDRGSSMFGDTKELERTAILDLAFPLEVRPINELLQHYRDQNRELFLALGAGIRDYPKKENADPKETQRAFFATDIAYGIVPNEENFATFGLPKRYAIPSGIMRQQPPARTHFFNALNYGVIPDDSFDVIQMANVLTDPKLSRTPLQQALRTLKTDTGEFVILNELGPLSFSRFHLEFMLSEYRGIVDRVIFHAEKEEPPELQLYERNLSVVSKQAVAMLQQNYHISSTHMTAGLAEGAYCVIAKKPKKQSPKNDE